MCGVAYHVCAVGNLPCVGVEMIWKDGRKSLNPPGGNWEQPDGTMCTCHFLHIKTQTCYKLEEFGHFFLREATDQRPEPRDHSLEPLIRPIDNSMYL